MPLAAPLSPARASGVLIDNTPIPIPRQAQVQNKTDVYEKIIAGSFLGKRIVAAGPDKVFVMIVDATLAVAGVLFLVRG